MLTLFQPQRAFGLPSPSAFCVKLETWLRMTDTPYELEFGDPRSAPKGKVPWVDDDGYVVSDSSFVISYLVEKHGEKLDGNLTEEQKALGHAVQKMLEESLYFVSSYSKWVEDDGFAIYAAELFADLPEEQQQYVPDMVREQVISKLEAQGVGRHEPDEVYLIGVQDLHSFSMLLGDNDYLFGSEPTSYDAAAFGVIGNLMDGPFVSTARTAAQSTPNLRAYITRIRERYFSDL
jgi:glutathione S-transferase